MELKKKRESEEKAREREEEAKLERRIQEQQERMKREFDEEQAKKKAKEQAVRSLKEFALLLRFIIRAALDFQEKIHNIWQLRSIFFLTSIVLRSFKNYTLLRSFSELFLPALLLCYTLLYTTNIAKICMNAYIDE